MHSELAYSRKGSGEPLVLIHGIGHRRQAWDPVFEQLAESYDVIAVDLAGFGESAEYPKGVKYNMHNAVENLTDNFAAWGIEKPHVVGNSLGGALALELGARGAVSSVTALSPAGFFGILNRVQTFVLLIMLRISSKLPDRVLKFVSQQAWGRKLAGATLYVHPERFSAEEVYGDALSLKRATGFEETILAGARYSFKQQVPVPTTIAWGTRDLILPYSSSAIAAERLPNARHVALPHCGHVPMVDDPDLIVRVVKNTVDSAVAAEADQAA
ncbi:pimeloyl-ACP methyl ester carboxylesterase [Aeromicrobium panaciterrae]|uniref:Pimeloyl-ACP methyl ester carboxylesterase n=1 Tax=Aeromicrobium panaciterrae TaxID=363861 RepID=A0ABU1UK87_9ACTN|nr:alpha/beta hydrolase [Aeromicrobium panaciterrae]MDR7085585.1 pimeloyl-ACP methyl ester carboxylesterase [Aeromicrobium panaciterrae]